MSELLIFDIPPGTRLADRFVIKEKLADGAAASVYRAETDENKTVALKILDPLRGADPVGRQRFLREFEILSRLDHVAIARCLDLVHHGELDILALEYIEGETLAARLCRGRLPVEEALSFGRALTAALSACHAAGVLHRDLKPANIMIHPERGPVILDFGVAWFSSAANLTRTGAVIGSPHYLAPEVFSGSLADARSDVYSVGAILFEMLTGRTVHLVESVAELVDAHRRTAPPSVYRLRPDVGPKISAIVTRAIAAEPERRFATMAELERALRTLSMPAGRELQPRLRCERCQTPLIIDLDLCPGCGKTVGWELRSGPYAVQLTRVRNPERTAAWIRARYRHAQRKSFASLQTRLRQLPVPLVVGASVQAAEQLAEEARKTDADAEIIRARAVLGARLQVAKATTAEALSALTLHMLFTIALGPLLLLFGVRPEGLAMLPAMVGAIGIIAARSYVRRPILSCEKTKALPSRVDQTGLSERLSTLKNDRARKLAAGAIARAAPILLTDVQGLPQTAQNDALEALERALVAVEQADAQISYLGKTSRARLGAQMAAVKAQLEAGQAGAGVKLVELEQEKREMMEAALAYDLAAKTVLEASQEISMALDTRM